jgi:hypothetical protein
VLDPGLPGLMVLLTARTGFVSPWSSPVHEVVVSPLSAEHLHQLATSTSEGAGIPLERIDELVKRSDGVPLFLEELVRSAVAGSAAGTLDLSGPSEIPAVLRDPLLARLSLPDVDLELAQVIATVGHEADESLLLAVTSLTPAQLALRMRGLRDNGLVERIGGDVPVFRFRHHLVGQLAYETQLMSIRRQRHGVVADVMATLDSHGVPADAGVLAYHLEHAARIAEAIEAFVSAARAAQGKGATAESLALLGHACDLLGSISDEKDRARLELLVRQVRGMVAVSAWGYTSAEAAADFHRCLELAELLGPGPEHRPSVNAAFIYYIMHGDLAAARRMLAVERERFSVGPYDGPPVPGGWSALALFEGRCPEALDLFARFFESDYFRQLSGVDDEWPFPDDPSVTVASVRGFALRVCGRPRSADASFRWAAGRAAGLPFPHGAFSAAYTKVFEMIAARVDDDEALIAQRVAEVREIADRHGFLFFRICADLHAALAAAYVGGDMAELDTAILVFRMAGLGVWDPWLHLQRAKVLLRHGDAEGARRACDDALQSGEETGAALQLAEVLRIRGLARIGLGEAGGAADLGAAANVAAEQGAVAFELLARAELARHGADPGDRARIERLLGEVEEGAREADDLLVALALVDSGG